MQECKKRKLKIYSGFHTEQSSYREDILLECDVNRVLYGSIELYGADIALEKILSVKELSVHSTGSLL